MGRIIPNEETAILFALTAPGALPAPVVTVTPAITGGTLAAATYDYRVVSLNASGHSAPSTEMPGVVASGTTGSNVITWVAATGETAGYDIYGRLAGVELKIGHVAHGVATFTDTGSVTPVGVLPLTATAYSLGSPKAADVSGATDLTHLTMSLNASATGNVVPTPDLSTLFESSIIGTSQATFTGDFYRDDETDTAWTTLTRGTHGWFIITRFGGVPGVGEPCEVWPVIVVSRSMSNMTSNTVETFSLTCSVPVEPAESAVVVA